MARSRRDDWGTHGGVVATRREFSVRDPAALVEKIPAASLLAALVKNGGFAALLRVARGMAVSDHHTPRHVPLGELRRVLGSVEEEDWRGLLSALCPSGETTADLAEVCCILARVVGHEIWDAASRAFAALDEGFSGRVRVSRVVALCEGDTSLKEAIEECCGVDGFMTLSDLRNLFAGVVAEAGWDAAPSLGVLDAWKWAAVGPGPMMEASRTSAAPAAGVPATMGTGVLRTKRGYMRAHGVTPSPRVFIDVSIDGQSAGRIVLELAAGESPRTVENFRCLCTGEKGVSSKGVRLWLKGVRFHRIVRGFVIQSGDIVLNDGRGGASIYGRDFSDEPSSITHAAPGVLSMVNTGPDTNNSQFFITTAPAGYLDGRFVSFGRVVEGMDVVMAVDNCGNDIGRPIREVVIVDCGQLS